MKQRISVLLEKQDDSLVRLTGLLYRRGYAIESLSSTPANQQGHIQVIAVISDSQAAPHRLCNYISKLFDVVSVELFEESSNNIQISY